MHTVEPDKDFDLFLMRLIRNEFYSCRILRLYIHCTYTLLTTAYMKRVSITDECVYTIYAIAVSISDTTA